MDDKSDVERAIWNGANDCWRRTGKPPDYAILGRSAYRDMLRSMEPPNVSAVPAMSLFGISVSVSDYVPEDVALLFIGGRCVGKAVFATGGWPLIYRAMAGVRPL